MIFNRFQVTSRDIAYQCIQREALDNEQLKLDVDAEHHRNYQEFHPLLFCGALGLPARGPVDNVKFAVFDPAWNMVGIFGLGCLQIVSGPWVARGWDVLNRGADVILTARPMPGFLDLEATKGADLTTDILVKLLTGTTPLTTASGNAVGFESISYAVLPTHDDRKSLRARLMHDTLVDDDRLSLTPAVDPGNDLRLLVKVEAA